jgi:hypothetical protein
MSQAMPLNTKPCVACREQIHADARKCPHCHQLQTYFANVQNTNAVQVLLIFLALGVIAYFIYLMYSTSRKDSTTPNLTVASGTIRVGTARGNPRVSCFATITNQDAVPWSGLSLQAEFFDTKGSRIDIHYYEPRATVHPSFSIEGNVSGDANAELSDYATCVMKVTNAH